MSDQNQEHLHEEINFSRTTLGVSMDRVSTDMCDKSRKNLSAILRAFSDVGQVRIGDALEIHEASVSRMKTPGGDLERIALILAACGISLNSEKQITVDKEVFKSALVLAKDNLNQALGG